mmetsp:Transcript_12687/g.14554  ORF Transcript_12687/g.14554 Transcript_12687/m.14554 type:complete len:416 (-) Transcript_12687:858-2105(-)
MEALTSRVLDERQPASLKWLSYSQKIPNSKAKSMLEEFVTKYKSDSSVNLHVLYLIAGKLAGSEKAETPSHHIRLVDSTSLETVQKSMDIITSKHVYSVQISGSTNPRLDLWNADFQNIRNLALHDNSGGGEFFRNRYGMVSYPNAEIDPITRKGNPGPSNIGLKSKESGSLYSNSGSTKLKGAVSAKAFFASGNKGAKSAKSTSNETSKTTKNSTEIAKTNLNATSGKTPKATASKEPSIPKPRKRKIIDSDEEAELDVNAAQNSIAKKRKGLSDEERKAREKEKAEARRKKREEVREMERKEQERLKKIEAEEKKSKFAAALGADSQKDSLSPKTTKQIKKVLVTKTYEDENGYLVTKDVYEEVEVEVEVRPKVESKPSAPSAKKTAEIKKPVRKKSKQKNMFAFFAKKDVKK